MKRPIIGALAGAALSVAVFTPTAGATSSPATISWGACSDPTLANAGAECGTLDVPLDPANPQGKTVTLALSRVRHKVAENAYQGVVLGAPNALGGTGLSMSLLGGRLPNGAGAAYDWVGFAQRGLAPSSPALSCDPNYFSFNRPNYVPTTPALEQQWLSRTKAYADACANNPADLLDHMKTVDIAADMDAIRTALGVGRVNVYAQSYGTYVAQVYATKYPSRVGRMVLDSIVNPRRIWYGAAAFDQNVPLQRNLEIWFDWLASHDDAYHLGKTRQEIQAVWDDQMNKLATAPAAGVIGPPEWIDVMLYPSYAQQTWSLLGGVFSNWVHNGDATALKAFFEQVYHAGGEKTYAALLAQVCTDAPWPSNWSQWRADSVAQQANGAKDTVWGQTWFNAPCLFWHARSGYPVSVYGSYGQTALLIDETLDAATPFEGSLEVRSRFPNAVLVSLPGGTNNAITPSGNACVDTKIADYLLTGTLPARKPGRVADVECAPLPLPTP